MRRYTIVLIFSVLLLSCGTSDSDELYSNTSLVNPQAVSQSSFVGDFVSDAHPTSGMVKVNSTKTSLSFENFKTDQGPKLLIYLSTTVDSTDYVNLGDLQGTEGNYTYKISTNTDLKKYKYVVIWCVDFSVSFGHAELK